MTKANSENAPGLTSAYARREHLLEAFEAAWRRGERPAVEGFLPPKESEPELLLDFLCADLEYRLKAGEPARAEDYWQRFPPLASDPALALALIAREYQLRRGCEPRVSLEEYTARFPQFRDELPRYLSSVARATPRVAPPGAATPEEPPNTPPPGSSVLEGTSDEPGSLGLPAVMPSTYPIIPGFEILDILGRGGMGVVYKARQIHLHRLVALKMVLAGAQAQPDDLGRFRAEAEAVAALQHPHIVQIFEVGEYAGLPFFALEYLEGGSLHQRLQDAPLPPREAAQLVETLARAMHAAHERGIIHRDLKPANVLLDQEGRPKIADFGLAKRVEGGPGLTQSGAIMGTPSYMAPEQASGQGKAVGPAADVYALGAILYELLTGRPPFKAATPLETVFQVLHEEPVPPRRLQSTAPGDLETVCLKCLEKEPRKRYASAVALAEDLRRFLDGKAITARPVRMWERGLKWAKRRPAVAVLLLLLILVVSGSVLGLARLWLGAEQNLQKAQQAEAKTQAINQFLIHNFLAVARPEEQGREITIRQALDAVAPGIEHAFEGQPDVEVSVRCAIGETYYCLALYPQAEHQARRALELGRQLYGLEHPDTLAALKVLTEVLTVQGRLSEAEPLLRQQLGALQRLRGPEHPDTLSAINDLAVVLLNQGKLEEAEQLLRSDRGTCRRALGPEHLLTLQVVNNLALLLLERGRPEEAEALLRPNLASCQRVLKPEHPETLNAMNHLANALQALGKLREAEDLFRRTLEARRRVLGPTHTETLYTLTSLAYLLQETGSLTEAESLFRDKLEICRRIYGPGHVFTIAAMNHLADVLQEQGKWVEVEPLFREILELRRKHMPHGYSDMVLTLIGLGTAFTKNGKPQEAEQQFREALRIGQQHLPKGHRLITAAEGQLGNCLVARSRFQEAEPLLLRSYTSLTITPGVSSRDLGQAVDRMIKLYDTWGKPKQAKEWRQKLEQAKTSAKDQPSGTRAKESK